MAGYKYKAFNSKEKVMHTIEGATLDCFSTMIAYILKDDVNQKSSDSFRVEIPVEDPLFRDFLVIKEV